MTYYLVYEQLPDGKRRYYRYDKGYILGSSDVTLAQRYRTKSGASRLRNRIVRGLPDTFDAVCKNFGVETCGNY